MPDELTSFPPEVADKLKTYVYRLIDPRNGETFYVGKGTGNRVFAHAREQVAEDESSQSNKLRRIREIRQAGFEVAHVIHRHGMDDRTAFEVEAALIDAYPGLTNEVDGVGSAAFGAMHALEIVHQLGAKPAVFEHKVLLINVNRTAGTDVPLIEATRYAWKVSLPKAKRAEYVLPTRQGIIVGAFAPLKWMEANSENFPSMNRYRDVTASTGRKPRKMSRGTTSASGFQTSSGSPVRQIRFAIRSSEPRGCGATNHHLSVIQIQAVPMTIACPRCEATFVTKATTATRCRACRSVVHMGAGRSGARRSPSLRRSSTTTWSTEPTDDRGSVLLFAAGLVLLVLVGYGIYRCVRGRRQMVAEQKPGAPLPPYDLS